MSPKSIIQAYARRGILYSTMAVAVSDTAYRYANAAPGEKLGSAADALAGTLTWGTLSRAGALLGLPGMLVGIAAGYEAEQFLTRQTQVFRRISDFGKRVRHINMGGDYQDTLSARRLRALAMRDMQGAMADSRRWLGQEALILHR